jgi:transcriptional regulator with XRE-family HTH domain
VEKRLTMRQVAQVCGVSVSTVWRWVLSGVRGKKLVSYHVGGRRYVDPSDLQHFSAAGLDARVQASEPTLKSQRASRQLDALLAMSNKNNSGAKR